MSVPVLLTVDPDETDEDADEDADVEAVGDEISNCTRVGQRSNSVVIACRSLRVP